MTRPTVYLLRMVAFLAAVAVTAALLWRALRAAFLNNPYLDGLIITILVIGIVWTINSVQSLLPAVRWIETMRQSRAGLVQTPPPALLSSVATALASPGGGRQGSRDRIAISTPAMQSLLDSLSGRLGESREVSRYLTSLLIFLGLLGTFYGLLLTVGAIADVISGLSVGNGDLDAMFGQLKSGLAKPLHGMATAFSGSLFGLASALVLGFLDLTAGQAQNRFFNELEEWLAGLTRFSPGMGRIEGDGSIPAYVQALLEQTAENLEALQMALRTGDEQRAQHMQLLSNLNAHLGQLAGPRESVEATKTNAQLHAIEQLLARMVTESERGRTQMTGDIRNDLRLLARTVAAASGQTLS